MSRKNYTGGSDNGKGGGYFNAGSLLYRSDVTRCRSRYVSMEHDRTSGGNTQDSSSGDFHLVGSQEPVWVVDGVIQRDPQPF